MTNKKNKIEIFSAKSKKGGSENCMETAFQFKTSHLETCQNEWTFILRNGRSDTGKFFQEKQRESENECIADTLTLHFVPNTH